MSSFNISLVKLSIFRSVSNSPLFSNPKKFSKANFYLSNTKFNQISNHVFYSNNFNNFLSVSKSEFHKTLSSAILIDSIDINQMQIDQNREYNNQNIRIVQSVFSHCNGTNGGAISAKSCRIEIANSAFSYNTAESGGAVTAINSSSIRIEQSSFMYNSALYTGALNLDYEKESNDARISSINVTDNRAKEWTGAMRLDRNGGILSNSIFKNNSAPFSGCFFDFTCAPAERSITNCLFAENKANYKGGAYTCFHVKHSSVFSDCFFVENHCENGANSVSVETVDIHVTFRHCTFSGKKDNEVQLRFDNSIVDFDDQTVFESNSTQNIIIQQTQ